MTPVEFDAWLSSVPDGARIPTSLEERNTVSELQALREWTAREAEIARLETALQLERSAHPTAAETYLRSTEHRLEDARRESQRLMAFLLSAGWSI